MTVSILRVLAMSSSGLPVRNDEVRRLAGFYRALKMGHPQGFGGVPRGREQGFVGSQSALDKQLQLPMQSEPDRHAKRAVGAGVHFAAGVVKLSYELFLRLVPKLGAPSARLGVRLAPGDLVRVFEHPAPNRAADSGPGNLPGFRSKQGWDKRRPCFRPSGQGRCRWLRKHVPACRFPLKLPLRALRGSPGDRGIRRRRSPRCTRR